MEERVWAKGLHSENSCPPCLPPLLPPPPLHQTTDWKYETALYTNNVIQNVKNVNVYSSPLLSSPLLSYLLLSSRLFNNCTPGSESFEIHFHRHIPWYTQLGMVRLCLWTCQIGKRKTLSKLDSRNVLKVTFLGFKNTVPGWREGNICRNGIPWL